MCQFLFTLGASYLGLLFDFEALDFMDLGNK